jgi:hypothetical protein
VAIVDNIAHNLKNHTMASVHNRKTAEEGQNTMKK